VRTGRNGGLHVLSPDDIIVAFRPRCRAEEECAEYVSRQNPNHRLRRSDAEELLNHTQSRNLLFVLARLAFDDVQKTLEEKAGPEK
jgi:hypothetical protein